MSKFDPNLLLTRELGPCGYAFYLACGRDTLGTGIRCLLVGLDSPAALALRKEVARLEEVIRENQRPKMHYFPEATEAMWCADMVLCRWLLDTVADRGYLQAYLKHVKAYLDGFRTKNKHATVAGFMPMCVIAGDCQYTLELMAATPNLKPPKSLMGVRTEAQMVYLLARARLGLGEYPEGEVRTAANRSLSRSVDTWLTDGDYDRVATWMMLQHWDGEGGRVSPRDALLRCYDYLDCDPPERAVAVTPAG